jgi:hypothetical protein
MRIFMVIRPAARKFGQKLGPVTLRRERVVHVLDGFEVKIGGFDLVFRIGVKFRLRFGVSEEVAHGVSLREN